VVSEGKKKSKICLRKYWTWNAKASDVMVINRRGRDREGGFRMTSLAAMLFV
jgi:hypothetical protein